MDTHHNLIRDKHTGVLTQEQVETWLEQAVNFVKRTEAAPDMTRASLAVLDFWINTAYRQGWNIQDRYSEYPTSDPSLPNQIKPACSIKVSASLCLEFWPDGYFEKDVVVLRRGNFRGDNVYFPVAELSNLAEVCRRMSRRVHDEN